MDNCPCEERYPYWMVLVCILHTLGVYLLGFVLAYLAHPFLAIGYVALALVMECRLLSRSCMHCHYYGRRCAFGRGRLSGLLFPPGDGRAFRRTDLSWKDMGPDVFMTMLPVLSGVWVLISAFSWWALLALVSLLMLITYGNALIRGKVACRHCKQRELGCPAQRLFDKQKEND